jgi:hypothetical protein
LADPSLWSITTAAGEGSHEGDAIRDADHEPAREGEFPLHLKPNPAFAAD